jgi:hypothetical protein
MKNSSGWLKESRRMGTRFEEVPISLIAMITFVIIESYLRLAFSYRALAQCHWATARCPQ